MDWITLGSVIVTVAYYVIGFTFPDLFVCGGGTDSSQRL